MADGGIIHRTKEKDKGTYCAAKISFMIVHYNATESALRNFCMHKHTWRLIDTINGAKASALVYSIVETAKENGVNPFRYLEFLLTEMMEHEEDTDYCFIDDLLPWSGSIPDIFPIIIIFPKHKFHCVSYKYWSFLWLSLLYPTPRLKTYRPSTH